MDMWPEDGCCGSGDTGMTDAVFLTLILFFAVMLVMILAQGIVVIKPWEMGVYMKNGRYVRMLDQGMSYIHPIVRDVVRIDMRPKSIGRWAPITSTQDGQEIKCYVTVNLRVSEPKKAFFDVTNYRDATMKIAVDEAQRMISSVEYDAVAPSLRSMERKIEHSLHRTEHYGVKVNYVELKIAGTESWRCPKCGRASPIGLSYCGYCGTAIHIGGAKSTSAEPVAVREEDHTSPHKIAMSYVPDNLDPPYEVDGGFPALRKKRRNR